MDADEGKLYVYRDSFAYQMSEYLGAQFSESCFRHKFSFGYEEFLKRDLDIFVYETVERYVDDLMNFSIE